jgi:HAD superfamily hydrolase (TIGR01509 family)
MLQAILWDNDGVLVDTERLFYEANRQMFRPLGLELTERHFFDGYLADNCGAWHLLQPLPDQAGIAAHRAERDRLYALRLEEQEVPAIDGVAALLAELAQGLQPLRMGIVTSCGADHFDIIHRRLDLRRHVEFVLTHETYVNSKPSPEPYLLGLQRLGLDAAVCVAIEDTPRGLQAALGAGLRCIVVRNALTRHHDFAGAYKVVDDIGQLRREIFALRNPA